jgi:cytochrome b pre-mRNA-processing protein 3
MPASPKIAILTTRAIAHAAPRLNMTGVATRQGKGYLHIMAFSLLKKWLGQDAPGEGAQALYAAVVAQARNPFWYRDAKVPDTMDGRFAMVSLVSALAMLRLETLGDAEATARLTEAFVADMEGQLREIGVGDVGVGKDMGKLMSALGGRLTVLRDGNAEPLGDILVRNVYGGQAPDSAALAKAVDRVEQLRGAFDMTPLDALLAGRIGAA